MCVYVYIYTLIRVLVLKIEFTQPDDLMFKTNNKENIAML